MLSPAVDRDASQRAQKALEVSMLEGGLHAIMVGVAESYLGAFAVELGHGPQRLAFLATLPLLAGACCQLFSPKLCAWFGSRKRVAMAGALGQTASLGLLLLVAAYESRSVLLLLCAKVGFWISAGAMAPAWNAWMASLTLHTHRPRYFARRSALNHLSLLIAFGTAGIALEFAGDQVLPCFVVLFAVGFVARLASVFALGAQADIEPPLRATGDPAILPRLGRALSRGRFRVAVYLALLAFGTQISAPFFTPYMLRELSLDYAQFAALSALSIFTKAITFPFCHRIADRVGLPRLLRWGGWGVALIPLVWALSSRFDALLFAHVLGGAAWAVVEYASFQLLLDAAPADHSAEFFSVSNAVTGVAQVTGSLCGGMLLSKLSLEYTSIFLLSGVLRGMPLVLLFAALRGGRFPTQLRALYARIVSVRPVAGAEQRPILTADEPESAETLPVRSTRPPAPF